MYQNSDVIRNYAESLYRVLLCLTQFLLASTQCHETDHLEPSRSLMRRFKVSKMIKHQTGLQHLQIYYLYSGLNWLTVDQYIKIILIHILLWPLLRFVFNIIPYDLNEMHWQKGNLLFWSVKKIRLAGGFFHLPVPSVPLSQKVNFRLAVSPVVYSPQYYISAIPHILSYCHVTFCKNPINSMSLTTDMLRHLWLKPLWKQKRHPQK